MALYDAYIRERLLNFLNVGSLTNMVVMSRVLIPSLEPVLFQPTPNMLVVYAVLVREDETFDPETQTIRRIYIKYGRSRSVPIHVQQHRVTYGMAVFLFMLPVPADMLVQCEGFLRDEFSMDEQQIPIILNGFERIEIVRV
ncbi:hypothetical protein BBI17_005924 [Phytophthora kernoviae]|uniref:Uncharacterized protein n=1 Tax=Phytophthora kernoviae TaxID=325452 RepID=A0A421FDR4_9STRA|nr:hypothetical protein BBI17_005924 [Phytophthora kernoviae]